MGKHANAENWHRFKPLPTAPEEWEEPEHYSPLTNDEWEREYSERDRDEARRAADWDHDWQLPDFDRIPRSAVRGRLWDEMGGTR